MIYFKAKLLTWITIVGLCCVLSGCQIMTIHSSPEEQFEESVKTLAASESLTFIGEAALRRNEQRQFEQHFTYQGQLTDHELLTMHSTLPVYPTNKGRVAATQDKNTSVVVDFRRMNGGWIHTSGIIDLADQALIRFNPLVQLEEISRYSKNITEEKSAPRGTRVLRIELQSEDALKWLDKQLTSEMDILHEQLKNPETSFPADTRSELEAIWKRGNNQLQTMLNHAKVNTTYHMTIDRKSNSPRRLTSESNMRTRDIYGNELSETMVNDVDIQL